MRLRDQPGRCAASLITKPENRCTSKVRAGEKLHSNHDILKNISRYNKETNYVALVAEIEKLIPMIFCGVHYKTALSSRPSTLRILKLKALVVDISNLSERDRSDFHKWANAISNPSLSSMDFSTADKDTKVEEDPSTSNASTTAPPAASPYTPRFKAYQPKWSKSLSVSSALLKKVTEPLKPSDLKNGFIYIFWGIGQLGMAKIGVTEDLEKRIKAWKQQCKRPYEYHTASYNNTSLPHARRIEQLIHFELKERRRESLCECGTMHKEWFEVSEAHVQKVFEKWRMWIKQSPYALDAVSGRWELRSEVRATLEEVCTPVPFESTSSPPRRRSVRVLRYQGRSSLSRRRSVV